VDAQGLEDYAVRWKGSRDAGGSWDRGWQRDPRALGRVDAAMLEIDLHAADEPAAVRDIVVQTAP